MSMLSDFQQKKLTYLFRLFDFKKNEAIRKDDFMELAEKISEELNLGEDKSLAAKESSYTFFRRMAKDMDPEAKYEVRLDDWLKFFDENVVNTEDSETVEEYAQLILSYIFGYFDENRDGYISIEEYENLFSTLGMSKLHSGLAFKRIDKNQDFRLSRYELILAVETFLTSDDPKNSDNLVFGNPLSEERKPV